jgi:hypothetical protein
MFETYRMLGRAHEDELARVAARPQGGAVTHASLVVRLLKRLSSPRSMPGKTGRMRSIAPPDTGEPHASAASPNP